MYLLILYLQKVSAADEDKGQRTRMEYEILGDVVDEMFEIELNSGIIHLNQPLDRDPPEGRPSWQFYVIAHDNDGSGNTLDGSCLVIVHLRDINDNTPIFERVRMDIAVLAPFIHCSMSSSAIWNE